MKELFREQDFARVGYYQSILEAEGIRTHVRNRDLVAMTTDIPIPEFFPALCVLDENDYSRAMEILRESRGGSSGDGSGEGSEDIPFETKGVVVAGIVVICAMFFTAALFGFVTNLAEYDQRELPVLQLIVSGGAMVLCLLAVIKVSLNYRATRRRAASPE